MTEHQYSLNKLDMRVANYFSLGGGQNTDLQSVDYPNGLRYLNGQPLKNTILKEYY